MLLLKARASNNPDNSTSNNEQLTLDCSKRLAIVASPAPDDGKVEFENTFMMNNNNDKTTTYPISLEISAAQQMMVLSNNSHHHQHHHHGNLIDDRGQMTSFQEIEDQLAGTIPSTGYSVQAINSTALNYNHQLHQPQQVNNHYASKQSLDFTYTNMDKRDMIEHHQSQVSAPEILNYPNATGYYSTGHLDNYQNAELSYLQTQQESNHHLSNSTGLSELSSFQEGLVPQTQPLNYYVNK